MLPNRLVYSLLLCLLYNMLDKSGCAFCFFYNRLVYYVMLSCYLCAYSSIYFSEFEKFLILSFRS